MTGPLDQKSHTHTWTPPIWLNFLNDAGPIDESNAMFRTGLELLVSFPVYFRIFIKTLNGRIELIINNKLLVYLP